MRISYDIPNSRISVIGAARSGIAAARLLRKHDVEVFLSEYAVPEGDKIPMAELESLGVEMEFGGHSERVFDASMLVVSPGIPSDAGILAEARERGIPIISELELASYFCTAPIIGITGTNGKTTTTTLTGEIFRRSGCSTIVAGNIGVAFSHALFETQKNIEMAVLEVSSYQLDYCVHFRPRIALITTITPDHLARYHGDFGEYVASKQRIFMNQGGEDALIYNADNIPTVNAVKPASSRKYPVSCERILEHGAWMESRKLVMDIGNGKETVANIDDLHLRGRHNFMNILMAAVAARLSSVSMDSVTKTVTDFEGVEHRLEFVRKINGVTWINDSKATNVDSVVIALMSFSQPVVLIAGGRDKEAPYDPLIPFVREKVKAMILIGESAERMEKAFAGHTKIIRANSMPTAVERAYQIADTNDIVLLSPACASFDMFENFEHRGLVFKKLVHDLRPMEYQV